MKPLAIIPTYLTKGLDVEVLRDCLKSMRETTRDGQLDILIVDDGSPDGQLLMAALDLGAQYGAIVLLKEENEGFSKTVNPGLRKALEDGRDAILVNADVEFIKPGWLERFQETQGINVPGPAAVVGALLAFPNGLIQHGGIYFSLLTREFNHLWKFAPMNLPAARQALATPVTGALQYIRHETLVEIGIYDERFKMGYEDVDYCLRVFLAGKECVYQPRVQAWHHESLFRGRSSPKLDEWHDQSFAELMLKYQDQNFAGLVPFR